MEHQGGRLSHVAHGVIRVGRNVCLAERLAQIHFRLLEVARDYAPDIAVVEKVFLASNPRSALVLGQARGVALAALAARGLEVRELAAREVKKAVAGTGAANKGQIQSMVVQLLKLDEAPPTDAADALAVALCQAHAGRLTGMGVQSRRRSLRKLASSLSRGEVR